MFTCLVIDSVKNGALDASVAVDTAENEPKEVYLRFPKGNDRVFIVGRSTYRQLFYSP